MLLIGKGFRLDDILANYNPKQPTEATVFKATAVTRHSEVPKLLLKEAHLPLPA